MTSIANFVESLFRQNSRAAVTQSVTSCVRESLLSDVIVPERLVAEHCVLLAALHNNIGMEIGKQSSFLLSLLLCLQLQFVGSRSEASRTTCEGV